MAPGRRELAKWAPVARLTGGNFASELLNRSLAAIRKSLCVHFCDCLTTVVGSVNQLARSDGLAFASSPSAARSTTAKD
jgi:hypothetical protein